MTIAKYTFFWIMVALSAFYILFSMIASILVNLDDEYIASLHLSTDGDSMGIPVFGAIFGSIILVAIGALYYALLWNRLEIKHSLVAVSITEFLSTKTYKIVVIFKYILLGLIAFIIFAPLYSYKFVNYTVLVFEMLSLICFVISAIGNLSLWNAISRSTKQRRV